MIWGTDHPTKFIQEVLLGGQEGRIGEVGLVSPGNAETYIVIGTSRGITIPQP